MPVASREWNFKAVIWVLSLLSVLFAAVAQHPFITYPLSLRLWKALKARPLVLESLEAWPALSILCCCYNEAGVIEEKIRNGLAAAANYPGRVQFLYFSDGSVDETPMLLRSHAENITAVISDTRAGKSVGIRELSARAEGDILVFTDANTFIAPDALVELAKIFADPGLGGAAGRLEYTNPGASETATVNSAYWSFEEGIKTLESETGSTMGADGAFFAVRRALHRPSPPDIIDDMHTSLNVILEGWRFVSAPSVLTFEKTPTSSSDEFERKIRIACRAFNCYRLLAPRIHRSGPEIVYKFYSHKVARWFGLFLVLLAALFGSAALGLVGRLDVVIAGALTAGAVGVLGALGIRPFTRLLEVFSSLLAVSLGIVESLRGKRYQVWKIARSGR